MRILSSHGQVDQPNETTIICPSHSPRMCVCAERWRERERERERDQPLQLLRHHTLLLLLPQHKQLMEGGRVEQFVVGHPVHLHLAGVVVIQQPGSRCLPTQLQEVVDLFNRLEGLLQNRQEITEMCSVHCVCVFQQVLI